MARNHGPTLSRSAVCLLSVRVGGASEIGLKTALPDGPMLLAHPLYPRFKGLLRLQRRLFATEYQLPAVHHEQASISTADRRCG